MPYCCRDFLNRQRGTKTLLRVVLAFIAGGIVLSLPEKALAFQLAQINFSQLPATSTSTNGLMYYVVNAAPGTPCMGGGSGAVAIVIGGVWSCGPLPGGTGTPTSVSCSSHTTLVGTGTFTAGSNNNAGSFSTPNTSTDVDNCTVTFSTPAPAARRCIWSSTNADGSAMFAGRADTSTSTTAKVDFQSAGSNTAGQLVISAIKGPHLKGAHFYPANGRFFGQRLKSGLRELFS